MPLARVFIVTSLHLCASRQTKQNKQNQHLYIKEKQTLYKSRAPRQSNKVMFILRLQIRYIQMHQRLNANGRPNTNERTRMSIVTIRSAFVPFEQVAVRPQEMLFNTNVIRPETIACVRIVCVRPTLYRIHSLAIVPFVHGYKRTLMRTHIRKSHTKHKTYRQNANDRLLKASQ